MVQLFAYGTTAVIVALHRIHRAFFLRAQLMELSGPASVSGGAYLGLALVFAYDLMRSKTPVTEAVLSVLVLLLSAVVAVYSINCMMVGNCVVWSWVQAAVLAIVTALVVISRLLGKQPPSPRT
jgi:hypothetical protein